MMSFVYASLLAKVRREGEYVGTASWFGLEFLKKGAIRNLRWGISLVLFTYMLVKRQQLLVPDDTTGGTFTITNPGALGGGYRFETVIINQPESVILGTGGITDRVIVRDGQIVIGPIMTYYFTYDHRIINGAVAAKFMANVTQLLKNPKSFISLEGS